MRRLRGYGGRLICTVVCMWLGSATAQASARTEFTLQGDLIGQIETHKVEVEDTLYDIARRYKVGLVQLMSANPGMDAWVPPPDRDLIISNLHILPPVKRQGVVINLSELRLFYYAPEGKIFSYPIGIGREGWQTPTGRTSITRKRKDPVWIPPASIRKEHPELPASVPAGPDNPLGAHAMNLSWPSYTIHGTNKPDGIGRRSSHGCIRMYPEDIAELFGMVQVGTSVTVVDTSHKLGWQDETLYLEVNPTQAQSDAIMEYEHVVPLDIPGLEAEIREAVKGRNLEVDWYMVKKIVAARAGIPVEITGAVGKNRNMLPNLDQKKVAPVEAPAPEAPAPMSPVPEREGKAAKPIPLGPTELPFDERPMLPIPGRGHKPSLQERLNGKTGGDEVFREEDLLPRARDRKQPVSQTTNDKNPSRPANMGGTKVYWR